MSATMRALTSLLALVGFYAFAVAIVVGLVVGALWSFQSSVSVGIKFLVVAVIAAVGIVIALVKVAKFRPEPPPGVDVTPADAPELWELVGRLAQTAGTRPPSQIRLVPDVNAAVSEDARMLGLVSGTRRLYLGVPLMQGLTAGQLTAVLGHELGHYSGSHTRLGPLAYRGRQAVVATVEQTDGIVGFLLKQYAKLYILLSQSMSRGQELEADRLMVRVVGRDSARGALREIPVLAAAWDFYTTNYVTIGWEDGLAPEPREFFVGFGHLLVHSQEQLAEIRASAPPMDASRWDSHPPIGERIAVIDTLDDDGGQVPDDPRPSAALIPEFWAFTAAVAAETIAYEGKEQLPWHELVHRSRSASDQRTADLVYRTTARLTRQQTATLHNLLELVHVGRLPELVREIAPSAPPEAHDDVAKEIFAVVLRAGLVQVGVARHQVSWDGPARLADLSGAPLEIEPYAALAADPATVTEAAEELGRIGVVPNRVGQVSTRPAGHGGDVVAGVADDGVVDVQVDGGPVVR